jgi:hypothetical protein
VANPLTFLSPDRIHFCSHPGPGPLGCGPPFCKGASDLSQCEYYSCSDGNNCEYKNDNSSDTDRYRLCDDQEDCDYQQCQEGDSGCVYNCDSGTCTQTSSSSACDEGDEECWEFYNYYNSDEQGDGANGDVNGTNRGYESSSARWKRLLYFLIPVLLLVSILACLITYYALHYRRQKDSKEESHPLKGSLARRMKLFTRLSRTKKTPPSESGSESGSGSGSEQSDYQNLDV